MHLTINYKSAEALALCCRLLEAAYNDHTMLSIYGENDEILNCLAKLGVPTTTVTAS